MFKTLPESQKKLIFAPQSIKKMAEEIKDEPIIDVQEAYSKTEQYIEENKKSLGIILGVIVGLVAIFLAWKYVYVAGKEKDAQKDLFVAEGYFEKDSLNKAINGDGQSARRPVGSGRSPARLGAGVR